VEQRGGGGLVSKENEAGTSKGRGTPSEPVCVGGDVWAVVLAEWGATGVLPMWSRRAMRDGQQGKQSR
jgi:hypothetical protein